MVLCCLSRSISVFGYSFSRMAWNLGWQLVIDELKSLCKMVCYFFFFVSKVPWCLRCCICKPLAFPFICLIRLQIFFAGVSDVMLDTNLFQLFAFAAFMVLRACAQLIFILIRFSSVGCLLKCLSAFFRVWITFLQLSSNHGLVL